MPTRPLPAPTDLTGARPLRALALRLRRLMWLKALGTAAGMWLFFVAYFHLLQSPAYPVRTMALTALDRWIPFQPEALFVYFSLWFYVALPPALLWGLRELVGYGVWVGALCAAGLLFFYFWPTAVPPLTIDTSGYPGFAVLRGVDAAGNAFPSMHVASAAFAAAWLGRVLRQMAFGPGWHVANVLWVSAICWSTVAVRQHVVLDVLGGLALGLVFAVPSLWWHRQALRR